MPIITPAYPSMCATHNITLSTKKVIVRELERANAITNEIFGGKKQWKELFQKHTFFTEGYKYYLSVIAGSRSKDSQTKWSGLVQSKVRRLVTGIEMSDAGVEVAHPFNKGFDRVHRCNDEEEANIALQGSLQFQVAEPEVERVNGSESDRRGSDNGIIIYTTTYYVGIELMQGELYCLRAFGTTEHLQAPNRWTYPFPSPISNVSVQTGLNSIPISVA